MLYSGYRLVLWYLEAVFLVAAMQVMMRSWLVAAHYNVQMFVTPFFTVASSCVDLLGTTRVRNI
jgi:hypothetical protein